MFPNDVFGAEIVTAQFMPIFKVKGHIYHKVGCLFPFSDGQHKYLQMFSSVTTMTTWTPDAEFLLA